jgi:hypothetical protein
MRPPTHTDPNAIPRNGTDVPWLELDDPSHDVRTRTPRQNGPDGASAAGDRQRRR